MRGLQGLLAGVAVAAVASAATIASPQTAAARTDEVVPIQSKTKKKVRRAKKRTTVKKKAVQTQEQQGSEGASDGRDSQATRTVGYAALFRQFQIDERSVGYIAVDAVTGQVLAARRPDGGFIPASAIKAPTAIMALNVLGANHRLSTRLYLTGSVDNGTLNGDLILVGGGDPELFTDDYTAMINALKARGIQRVKGRFIFDNSLFPDSPSVSSAHDNDVSYNAGVGALSLNFNRLRLRWIKSRNGMAVTVYSKTDRLAVPVNIVTGAIAPAGIRTPRGVAWDDSTSTPRWLVSQRVRRSGEMWVPVKRVGLHAAHVFQQFAKASGILIPGPLPGRKPAGAAVVASHRADALVQVARRFLKYSNNVATEMVGQTTTRLVTGKPLSIDQSGEAMAAWYRQKLPQVNWAGLRIANHSGLSRDTSISPRQMAAILRWARTQNYAGYRLWDILRPYWVGAGQYAARRVTRQRVGKRRVRSRKRTRKEIRQIRALARKGVAGPGMSNWMQVRGKTGTINHARSLAGYMVTRSKREIVFAVFIDDDRAQLAAAEAGQRYKRLSPGRWSWRSRAVLRGILRKWILEF